MTTEIKIGETIKDFRLRDQKRDEGPPVLPPACLDESMWRTDEIT